jgi:iron transport multicopper oxidase
MALGSLTQTPWTVPHPLHNVQSHLAAPSLTHLLLIYLALFGIIVRLPYGYRYDYVSDRLIAHNRGQYPDGLRGPLIVHDPKSPYDGKCEKEYILTLSDWYHQQTPDILKFFQSPANFPPITPIPDSPIMNDGESTTYEIKHGKQYLFRILNMGAFPSFFLNFQDHEMTIVGIDGVRTQPTTATTLYVGAAQRYEVIITGKKNATSNAAILAMFDTSMFEAPYNGSTTVLGELEYKKKYGPPPPYQGLPNSIMPPIDDLTIKPYDNEPLLGPVTKRIPLDFNFAIINGIPRAIINNSTYLPQIVPTLYTALSVPQEFKLDPRVYGVNSNSYPVQYGDIVEIVINNLTPFGHPFHLHGHQFQVVARSQPNAVTNGQPYNPSQADPLPMKRDVAGVHPGGFVVFRFKAENPGVQLIHCHIEWHVEAGLTATILEATDHLGDLHIPDDHKAACIAGGMPFTGNAAGNTQNPLDLTGANTQVQQTNTGALWTGNPGKSRMRKVRGRGSLL